MKTSTILGRLPVQDDAFFIFCLFCLSLHVYLMRLRISCGSGAALLGIVMVSMLAVVLVKSYSTKAILFIALITILLPLCGKKATP